MSVARSGTAQRSQVGQYVPDERGLEAADPRHEPLLTQIMAASSASRVSDDGRLVLFYSSATNLSLGSPPRGGAYLRDRLTRTTQLISFAGAAQDCAPTAMTGDGRFATFVCNGINAYWRELPSGSLARIFDSAGPDARPDDIGGDGRFITLSTSAAILPIDTNGRHDVYLFDRAERKFQLISVNRFGGTGWGYSDQSTISGDGRYVSFISFAATLVPTDRNHTFDAFIRDRLLKTTQLVSVSTAGRQADAASHRPFIGDDGSVVFMSDATTLIQQDTTYYTNIYVRTDATQAAPAEFTLQPREVAFGSVAVGSTSPSHTLTVTNTGVNAFQIDWIGLAGTDAADFQRTRQCPGVEPGQNCTVTVVFAPLSTGAKAARLVVSANGVRKSTALSGMAQ
jgi:hypothetical protein